MDQIGKLIIFLGLILTVLGLVVWGLGRMGFRGLPGDIDYRSENFRFYFPIVTCIVISVLASVLVWLWNWLRRG